jgi:hypothetical protein
LFWHLAFQQANSVFLKKLIDVENKANHLWKVFMNYFVGHELKDGLS